MSGQRVTPEAIAEALIQYETGGMCHFGQTCGLCDCGKADETPEQTQARDAMELAWARAVLTQAQAAALRQAARDWSDWDGLSAPEEWLARRAAAIESGATHG